MKSTIQRLLQTLMGYNSYLFIFSIFRIKTIKNYELGFTLFMNMIENKGIIIDVGANIGITAIPLASKFKKAVVYAFEPIENNFNTLQRVVRFFGLKNVIFHRFAIGSYDGEMTMVTPVQFGVKKQGLSKRYDNVTAGIVEDVVVKRLDSFIFKSKVKAIKIDVEGHELEVLKGAQSLLNTDHPLVYCELWNNPMRYEAIAFMEKLGYSTYIYDEKSKKLEYYTTQNVDNFLFKAIV